MKKLLLLSLTALWAAFAAQATQVDPWTISFDTAEESSDSTKVAPGDAPYYLHTFSNNTYYPLTLVEGSSPAQYTGYMPIIVGDFKVFNTEWYSTSGGSQNDKYVYGSSTSDGTVTLNTAKTLANPGNNMQIGDGSTWYGVEMSFYPNGTSSSSTTPTLIMTAGSQTADISIDATGTFMSPTSGKVNFTIKPGGIVDSEEQTYEVSISYTNSDGTTVSKSIAVANTLEGSFTVTDLAPGATTNFTLTVSIDNAPVADTVNASTATSYKDLTGSGTCSITTPRVPYLVGDLTNYNWDTANGIKGQDYNTIHGTDDEATYGVMCWYDVPLTGTYRFSFNTYLASTWDEVDKYVRYNPTSVDVSGSTPTKYCLNMDDNADNLDPFTGNWYASTAAAGSDTNAWAPAIAETSSTSTDTSTSDASKMYYQIFLNQKTNEVAIGWQETTTAIANIFENPQPEATVVDVYNLQGAVVRHHVMRDGATAGLPGGIYIVAGKKIAVH